MNHSGRSGHLCRLSLATVAEYSVVGLEQEYKNPATECPATVKPAAGCPATDASPNHTFSEPSFGFLSLGVSLGLMNNQLMAPAK